MPAACPCHLPPTLKPLSLVLSIDLLTVELHCCCCSCCCYFNLCPEWSGVSCILHVQTNGRQPGVQTDCAFWPTAMAMMATMEVGS